MPIRKATIGAVEKLESSQADERWTANNSISRSFAGKTIRLAFTSENPRGQRQLHVRGRRGIESLHDRHSPNVPQVPANSVYLRGTVVDSDTRRGVSGAPRCLSSNRVSRPAGGSKTIRLRREAKLLPRRSRTAMVLSDRFPCPPGAHTVSSSSPAATVLSSPTTASPFQQNAKNPFSVDATLRQSR